MDWVMGGNRMHIVRESQQNGLIRAMCGLSIYQVSLFQLKDPESATSDLCRSCLKIEKKSHEPEPDLVVWRNGLN